MAQARANSEADWKSPGEKAGSKKLFPKQASLDLESASLANAHGSSKSFLLDHNPKVFAIDE
jgi:hypothetical protein